MLPEKAKSRNAEPAASDQHIWLRIRPVLVAGALVSIAVALFADALGLGRAGSWGTGQTLLILVGLATLALSWLGPARSGEIYRSVSITLLSTIVVLALGEMASIALFRSGLVGDPSRFSSYLDLDYYKDVEWSRSFWDEAARAEKYEFSLSGLLNCESMSFSDVPFWRKLRVYRAS